MPFFIFIFLQVTFKPDLSTAEVHDEHIRGNLKVRNYVRKSERYHIFSAVMICSSSSSNNNTSIYLLLVNGL